LCQSLLFHSGIKSFAIFSNSLSEIFSGNFNINIRTLLIFVSITGSGRFRANEQIALAVYGPIHGRERRASLLCGSIQLYCFIICFAHSCSLMALELNHSHDRYVSRSIFDNFASVL
jgi:hypothetical protein